MTDMKKIIIISIFLIFSVFLIDQNVIAESENDKEREKEVKDAGNKLKRETTEIEPKKEDKLEKDKEEKITKKLSKLKKFLPTEEELDKITLRTVWRYVDKQSDKNEDFEIERIQALIRDI